MQDRPARCGCWMGGRHMQRSAPSAGSGRPGWGQSFRESFRGTVWPAGAASNSLEPGGHDSQTRCWGQVVEGRSSVRRNATVWGLAKNSSTGNAKKCVGLAGLGTNPSEFRSEVAPQGCPENSKGLALLRDL